jgi:hypothetical protein
VRVKRLILLSALLGCVAFGCGDDEDEEFETGAGYGQGGGVCELAECPAPPLGVACCTPTAQCGWDPSGIGTNCAPNIGAPLSDNVCRLDACPLPPVGVACCTPFGLCGTDPFATGQACFPNPPPINVEPPPAVDAAAFITCDVDDCEESELGAACCLPNGECGVDVLGIGFCFPPPPPPVEPAPNPFTQGPPNDPTVDGQCPSVVGFLGPIWGCCSPYGACGTYDPATEACVLPVGTPIPLSSAPDGGIPVGVMECEPENPIDFDFDPDADDDTPAPE